MTRLDPTAAITDMDNTVKDWTPDTGTIDEGSSSGESTWDFPDANRDLGYYQLLPEYKKSNDILGMYTTGAGISSPSNRTKIELQNITGMGEDTIESILWNMVVVKKFAGDSMAEIIRDDDGRLLNLKPLWIGNMKTVLNSSGIIIRYEQTSGDKASIKFPPHKILHMMNDRIANQIHGTSSLDAVKWAMDAKNEALDTMRKVQRRLLATGVLILDVEDATERAQIISKYQDAINSGDVLVFQKGIAEIEQMPANQAIPLLLEWIRYLDDFSYRALGVPLILAGGSGGSEGSDKTGFLTFDQVWKKEQRELAADLWNQMAIRVTFNEPASINPNVTENEGKNTSQTGFQPKEVTATVERE